MILLLVHLRLDMYIPRLLFLHPQIALVRFAGDGEYYGKEKRLKGEKKCTSDFSEIWPALSAHIPNTTVSGFSAPIVYKNINFKKNKEKGRKKNVPLKYQFY